MPVIAVSTQKLVRRFLAGVILAPSLLLTGWAFPSQAYGNMPRGEKHEGRQEIFRLEEKWRAALLKGDASALAALLSEDFMNITAKGTLQSKEQTLAGYQSGGWHFNTLNVSERKVRFYGTTALVTSMIEVQGIGADGNVSGDYRYTHVYARDTRGKWKLVNAEASHVRQPGEPK